VVMVDLKGEILDHIRIRTQNYPWEAYLPLIRNSLKEMLERNQIPVEKVLGAGVTLPAIIGEDHRTIQYLTLLDLPADFYDALGEAIPFPYRFCNDANGAGFAELWKRKTSATMLYLFLSATVGGAILQNGRIYMGAHQRGGEFGHMTLIPDGKKCYCGKKGCVDCYLASGVLSEYTEGRMEDFFRLLDEGDRECVRRWQEYSRYLAIVINNLQCAYDCKIVIGGHIGGFIEKYLKDIRAMVASRNTHSAECDYVEASMMKWEASAMGGALLYIDEFIKNI
ncbi:MAG: ROK family protein, partial [Oliverpabstia sp.]|nr:ROK family protein [Oliverpabstia sp.]